MLYKFYGWLAGWRETLIIKYRYPELYRELISPVEFPGDFVEVGAPE